MSPALFAIFALFADLDLSRSLAPALVGASLLGAVVLGAVGDGWWGTANRARNARGGPVKPATTRDYILVTVFFVISVACIFVGLYFMKR
jgi:hypothetical protein